jgi:hypothetical protein
VRGRPASAGGNAALVALCFQGLPGFDSTGAAAVADTDQRPATASPNLNARTVMALFRPVSEDEIVPGCGSQGSKAAALAALILHFLAWGTAGLVWLNLLADTR